jgi:hypothetical protein
LRQSFPDVVPNRSWKAKCLPNGTHVLLDSTLRCGYPLLLALRLLLEHGLSHWRELLLHNLQGSFTWDAMLLGNVVGYGICQFVEGDVQTGRSLLWGALWWGR